MQAKFTKLTLICFCFTLMASLPYSALAEWSHDPTEGNFLAPADGKVISDGFGGGILVISDPNRENDLYAYHVNYQGDQVWGSAGVPVYANHFSLNDFEVISDGQGGAYLAISEFTGEHAHIWLQHLSASGTLPWGLSGVDCAPLVTTYSLENPVISLTGSGGLIMACNYQYTINDSDILLQIIDTSGNRYLSDLGEFLYNTTAMERSTSISYDGVSGYYLISEFSNASEAYFSISHLNINGDPDWPVYPTGIIITNDIFFTPYMVVNSSNEAMISWANGDNYPSTDYDISLVKIGRDSEILWFTISVCNSTGAQTSPQITADDQGGCWVFWDDSRGSQTDVFMQHIDANQVLSFEDNGIPVGYSSKARNLAHSVLTSDGNLAVTWYDISQNQYDIYCNLLKSPAVYIGNPYGQAMATGPYYQDEKNLLPDNNGGVISFFSNSNPQYFTESYFQRIGPWGFLGDANPAITLVADHPQDQGGVARVTWNRSYLDNYFDGRISEYVLMSRRPGSPAKAASDSREDLQAFTQDGWTFLESVQPYYLPQYASNAPTYGDSTSAGIPYTQYMVLGITTSGILESNVLSGYSVDNLAPGAPSALAANADDTSIHLQWTPTHYHDEDLLHYNLYRSASPMVQINAENFLASSTDSTFVDESLPSDSWHYIVTAMDVHGNESPPSNETLVQIITSAGGDLVPRQVAVQGAWPNPFNPTTTIKYSVPGAGEVQLTIFNVRGRNVRTLVSENKQPGFYEVTFDGRDRTGQLLASGVYFVHLKTADGVSSKKIVLAK